MVARRDQPGHRAAVVLTVAEACMRVCVRMCAEEVTPEATSANNY